MRLAHERDERLSADFGVELSFVHFAAAITGKVVNVGRERIFVAVENALSAPGSKVHFKIQSNTKISLGLREMESYAAPPPKNLPTKKPAHK